MPETLRGTTPLVFVVGNSRSGTTLMSRVLSNHPDVFAFHELHYFEGRWTLPRASGALAPERARREAAWLLSAQRDGHFEARRIERYLAEASAALGERPAPWTPAAVFEATTRYEAGLHGASVVCEQTPRNVHYARELLALYPEARIVSMVRDPRDVLLSQKGKWRRRALGARNIPRREALRAWMNYHPRTISLLWNAAVAAQAALRDQPRVLTIRFEDLIGSPRDTVAAVAEFLRLEPDEAMLAVPTVGSSTAADGRAAGFDAAAVGRWRRGGLRRSEIALCEAVTAAGMAGFGYEPASAASQLDPGVRIETLLYTLSWPIKTGLAMLFNLHRSRNILASVWRRLGATRSGAPS